jgi:hypothetical protein
MPKYRMGSLEVGGKVLTCTRGHDWPPLEIVAYGPTAEDAREKIKPAQYERVKVWERTCGLLKMSEDKCPQCPLVARDGEPALLPGSSGPVPKTYRKPEKPIQRISPRKQR